MRSSAKKKRVGRPPGRIAPHRPVLSASARVSQELYDAVCEAARRHTRSISEEVAYRVELSFEIERALGDAAGVREHGYREANAALAFAARAASEVTLEKLAERAATRAIEKMRAQS